MKKVLVLEDHTAMRTAVASVLKKQFEVYSAATVTEADKLFGQEKFDAALIDIRLEGSDRDGISAAKRYRVKDPFMAILLWTAEPHLYFERERILADDCLSKVLEPEQIIWAIENAIWRRQMPFTESQKLSSVLHSLLPYGDAVRFIHRSGSTGVERMDGLALTDDKPLAWVTYSYPYQPDRVVICPASTVGCGLCRGFCRSGERQFQRRLFVSELIAQVLHGLRSYHARPVWQQQDGVHLAVNFTAEGDIVFNNVKNGCRAVEILARELKALNPEFIFTSIGHVKNYEWMLENYPDLPVRHYLSVHLLDAEQRKKFMPAASSQSIFDLRDVLRRIAERTGRPATVSWMVIRGINDREEDADSFAALFGHDPLFEIKVSAVKAGSMSGITEDTQEEDVDRVISLLQGRNVPCRKREVIGRPEMSCGGTIPRIDI